MNYFEYFSEIEERFSRRRGSILLLNTLDWALIETWREAGIPLEAVLRGIDNAFDKFDAKYGGRAPGARGRTQKVNGLAWCSQAVLAAAEELVEASTGLAPVKPTEPRESGFETNRVAAFLTRNALALEAAAKKATAAATNRALARDPAQANDSASTHVPALAHNPASAQDSALKGTGFSPSIPGPSSRGALAPEGMSTTATRLHELAATMRYDTPLPLDDLDRTLTVLEEKLLLTLQSTATEQQLVDLRAQADRELAPYRSKISATQLRQIHQQFLHKRLLELHAIPRLSLFYMGHEDDPQDAAQ